MELGDKTFTDSWLHFYSVIIPIQTRDKSYILAHDENKYHFIQEITEGGELYDTFVEYGNWRGYYNCIVSYNLPSGTYVYGTSQKDLCWFVSSVDPKTGKLTDIAVGKLENKDNQKNYWTDSKL
ncbi:hypothetical protein [Photorhabdus temperata]|uniref:hypothetical protein n=1 Tax=Photorhabdus temperata TaxID=574560 RepID=UPI00038A1F8D|nr:hypothetical protein [Photorhabdus temperata]EQB97955.1 hypothetical protein B738_27877 [Photorhabdus temperata subsp. temperata M1021]